MKKICTFTLEGEIYPSKEYGDKLRLFAYMLYDLVYNYYGDGIIPLNINKNIVYNNLHIGIMNSGYFFDSDVFDNGIINYEPFLIGTHSFGLTIFDDLISEEILMDLVKQVSYMLKIKGRVTFKTVEYCSKNTEDEKNRRKAMNIVFTNLGCQLPQRKFLLSSKKDENDTSLVFSPYPEFRRNLSRKKHKVII